MNLILLWPALWAIRQWRIARNVTSASSSIEHRVKKSGTRTAEELLRWVAGARLTSIKSKSHPRTTIGPLLGGIPFDGGPCRDSIAFSLSLENMMRDMCNWPAKTGSKRYKNVFWCWYELPCISVCSENHPCFSKRPPPENPSIKMLQISSHSHWCFHSVKSPDNPDRMSAVQCSGVHKNSFHLFNNIYPLAPILSHVGA